MAAPAALADRVVKPAPEVGFDLFIFSMYEKPGWRTRVSGDRIRAPHPGTGVSYEDSLYEVIQISPAEGTPYTYRYALRNWEDRFVARQVIPYTMESQRAQAAELREQHSQYRRHSWLVYVFPMTALLPTPLLNRWQREFGLPMRGACFASALLLCFLGTPLGIRLILAKQVIIGGVLLSLAVEQVVRLFWLLSSEAAVGSFLATTLWGVWTDLRGLAEDGTPRRRKVKAESAPERDEVRRLVEQPWDIEVWSNYRVPSLVGEEPVRFEEAVYQPLGYRQQGEGVSRRYVFRLKKLEDGQKARREYNPEHSASQVARLMVYERDRDRVHRWALLCGYLPAARQLELESKYDYDPVQGTERAALVLILAAGMQLASALVRPFALPHVVAVGLIAESLYRLALVHTRAEPSGSLFGWMLYPLLRF